MSVSVYCKSSMSLLKIDNIKQENTVLTAEGCTGSRGKRMSSEPSCSVSSGSKERSSSSIKPPLPPPPPQQTPKDQYRVLKRRFKFLVYENECYQEELRNLQRKLLKLSRDKNFLLDRLMLYEKIGDSSDDSDSSLQTKIEEKKPKRKARPSQAKKKSEPKKPPTGNEAGNPPSNPVITPTTTVATIKPPEQ